MNETATIRVAASGGGYSGVSGSVAVTAIDPDVTFSIDDVSVEEGATDTVTVTVTRAGAGDPLTVPIAHDDMANIITLAVVGGGSSAMIMEGMTSAEVMVVITASDAIAGEDDVTITVTVEPGGVGRGLPVDGIEITIVNDDDEGDS